MKHRRVENLLPELLADRGHVRTERVLRLALDEKVLADRHVLERVFPPARLARSSDRRG
jgi:hypothetical protein